MVHDWCRLCPQRPIDPPPRRHSLHPSWESDQVWPPLRPTRCAHWYAAAGAQRPRWRRPALQPPPWQPRWRTRPLHCCAARWPLTGRPATRGGPAGCWRPDGTCTPGGGESDGALAKCVANPGVPAQECLPKALLVLLPHHMASSLWWLQCTTGASRGCRQLVVPGVWRQALCLCSWHGWSPAGVEDAALDRLGHSSAWVHAAVQARLLNKALHCPSTVGAHSYRAGSPLSVSNLQIEAVQPRAHHACSLQHAVHLLMHNFWHCLGSVVLSGPKANLQGPCSWHTFSRKQLLCCQLLPSTTASTCE